MRILIVEDDPSLGRQLEDRLTSEGYAVELAADGEEAQFLGETEPYDAVVLDLGLPKRDGLSVLRAWREEGNAVPVLVLTARDHWHDTPVLTTTLPSHSIWKNCSRASEL